MRSTKTFAGWVDHVLVNTEPAMVAHALETAGDALRSKVDIDTVVLLKHDERCSELLKLHNNVRRCMQAVLSSAVTEAARLDDGQKDELFRWAVDRFPQDAVEQTLRSCLPPFREKYRTLVEDAVVGVSLPEDPKVLDVLSQAYLRHATLFHVSKEGRRLKGNLYAFLADNFIKQRMTAIDLRGLCENGERGFEPLAGIGDEAIDVDFPDRP